MWFTHNFGGTPADIVSAPIHTEATANVYAQLEGAIRVLDTARLPAGRTSSTPRATWTAQAWLEAGKTIYINLDSQVYFAEAVFANLTVTGQAALAT